MSGAHALAALGLAVSVLAVLIQFPLGIRSMMEAGMSMPGAVIAFFSYFTILTNIFAALVYLAALSGGRMAFFRRPATRACALVSIVVVGIVYHFLLAGLWNPQGIRYVTDVMLHYAAPALMLVWWVACGRSGTLSWTVLPSLLAYPALYVVYVLVRAPIAGKVPYPFLDFWTNGWGSVAWSALGIAALFGTFGALAILADRHLPKQPPDRTPA